MNCTSDPSSSGSYSGLLPRSGGVCWPSAGPCSGLLARSLLSHPGHQRSQLSLLSLEMGYSLSLLPVLPQGTPVHSWCMVGPSVSNGLPLALRVCSPSFVLTHYSLL